MATELKTRDGITQQIEVLKHVAGEIRNCRDIPQVKKVADWAQMIALAAKRVGATLEVQNEATEGAIRVRHWEGTLLREMPPNRGAAHPGRTRSRDGTASPRDAQRPSPPKSGAKDKPKAQENGRPEPEIRFDPEPLPPTLESLGITKNESSRAQAIAAIPDELLDEALETVKASGKELTTKDFVNLGRTIQAEENKSAPPAPSGNGHVPAPSQDDRDEAAARWNKLTSDYATLIRGFTKNGGPKVIARGWKRRRIEAMVQWLTSIARDAEALRAEFQELLR